MGSIRSDVLRFEQPQNAGQRMCLATVLAIALLSCVVACVGLVMGLFRSL